MARKLKTFVTTMGFFDLAVAAPSMKAALEAWGVKRNVFHHGMASETQDRAIVAATMARPGAVLRRPVGTNEPFQQDAALPAGFSLPAVKEAPAPKTRDRGKARARKGAGKTRAADKKNAPAAIISFEKERAKRERARAREDQAARREAEKRSSAIEKAQSRLEDARKSHQGRRDALTRELDRRLEEEEARWAKARAKLEAALDKARKG